MVRDRTLAALTVFVAMWAAAAPPPTAAQEQACANCHREIVDAFAQTGMGRSFQTPTTAIMAGVLGKTFHHVPSQRFYTTTERDGRYYQRRHQVDDSGTPINVFEKEIHYVMGSGNHARTFLNRSQSGKIVELPLGWYAENGGILAMSPGYDQPRHRGFLREIDADCMFCHNAYAEVRADDNGQPTDAGYSGRMPLGINCQRCHGPAREHVAAARSGMSEETIRGAILNPAKISVERQLEVCMQCHLETTSRRLPHSIRRFERGAFSYRPGEQLSDYILHFDHAPSGESEDRFEIAHAAYRLRQSACFRQTTGGPQALTCTTCHDPHRAPRSADAAVTLTQACRNCHAESIAGRADHPAGRDCASCHMPKRRTADVVHVVMTDHYIQRRPPAGDLTAARAEMDEGRSPAYRGPVVPYYPLDLASRPEGDLYLAVAQVKDGANLEQGVSQLEAAIERRRPENGDFYFHLAEAYGKLGRNSAAFRAYEAAIRRDPGQVIVLRSYGNALSHAGMFQKAEQILTRAAKLAPDDALTLSNLSAALLSLRRPTEALAAAKRALASDPDLPQAHQNVAAAYSYLGNIVEAQAAAREAIRIQPDFAIAHHTLANALGESAEADPSFREAIRLGPDDADAHFNYGSWLAKRQRGDLAEPLLRRAIDLSPGLPKAHLNLGIVVAEKGDFVEAIQHFRTAVEQDPQSATAHLTLGLAMAARNEHALAARTFRRAVELAPRNMLARLNLGATLARLGDPSAAQHLRVVESAAESSAQMRAAARKLLDDVNR